VSTPALKRLIGVLIALGILVMVGWPLIVGAPPPKGSPRSAYRPYVVKGLAIAGTLTVIVVGAGVGAFFLIRRTRDEYRQESMRNLRTLIEGTREDQLRKQSDEQSAD
jgi:multisubunit Na+/H+ antiporter MnhC subunit